MKAPAGTVVFERGDNLYLVGPVAPFEPKVDEELAFADQLKAIAPNENLLWLRGQYVEADNANDNGAYWSSDELEIASLTPMLMPVTVMHDPRTAVGMIADTQLLTRDKDDVPRSRIDATLGVWKHRFPDVAEEIAENYKQGSLMQSMECRHAYYDCGECGKRYPKLPGGAERANWCDHLRGETAAAGNGKPVRRLGAVTFTGTGLIFGTQGARGAYQDAGLEVFQDEVAEFHEQTHTKTPSKRRTSKMDTIEIERKEYDDLKAKAAKSDELAAQVSTLEETAAKVPDLEAKVEAEETAKKTAETERDDLKTKVDDAEEKARADELAKDRIGKLGDEFTGKLGEFTRGRLEEQAGKLSDEDWDARLKELEEVAAVKRDAGEIGKTPEKNAGETFTEDELARSNAGGGGSGGGGGGSEPTAATRKSVVAGLVKATK